MCISSFLRYRHWPCVCFLILGTLVPIAAKTTDELKNELSGHASPYLAMHGEDPVHWQYWGAQALRWARSSGKLIFISSGYFSCHWCHVMQRESYQDPEIAGILNRAFISVKVDRELEPVLDAWLMEFIQETRGRGGWPLNIFMTPQGHPLIGTLYKPPAEFKAFLLRLEKRWLEEKEVLSSLAAEAAESMKHKHQVAQYLLSDVGITELEDRLLSQTLQFADELAGGFGYQAKFPFAPKLAALLALYRKHPSERLRGFLTLSLRQMSHKGLYDHLGSGFYRYTIDPYWRVPHFEKMLYDNAQLVPVYLLAADLFSEPDFEQTAFSVLDFMLDEMTAGEGAFVAALSAVDDQGREGGYYLWDLEVLENVITAEEYSVVKLAWGLSGTSEFEHGYLPIQSMSVMEIADSAGEDPSQITDILHVARQKLLAFRAQRGLPIDDKLLSSWNGLTLAALSEGVARDPLRYTAAAQDLRDFIVTKFWRDKALTHAVDRDGEGLGPGNLEDYANISKGLFAWSRVSGQAEDLRITAEIVAQAWSRFYTDRGWRMTETSLVPAQPVRRQIADSHIPSPSATLVGISLEVLDRPVMAPHRKHIRENLKQISRSLATNPFIHSSHVAVLSQLGGENSLE